MSAKKTKRRLPTKEGGSVRVPAVLLGDVRAMIAGARRNVAQAVDSTLVTLHWNVGQLIGKDVLGGKRAAYGKQIVSVLGRELTAEFGRGFSEKSLWHMIRFEEKVRLLRLEGGNIRVAAYLTELPPRKMLEQKLHEAVQIARHKLASVRASGTE